MSPDATLLKPVASRPAVCFQVLALSPEGHSNVHELRIVAENVPRGVKL